MCHGGSSIDVFYRDNHDRYRVCYKAEEIRVSSIRMLQMTQTNAHLRRDISASFHGLSDGYTRHIAKTNHLGLHTVLGLHVPSWQVRAQIIISRQSVNILVHTYVHHVVVELHRYTLSLA